MTEGPKKKIWKTDEGGIARDCIIACIAGIGLFMLIIVGIYASGKRIAW